MGVSWRHSPKKQRGCLFSLTFLNMSVPSPQRVPAEEITYETLKKAIGKTAAQETLRSREVGADMDLVAEAGGFLKLSGPQAAAGSPHSLKGVGTAYHCVSSLRVTHPLSAFNDNYL